MSRLQSREPGEDAPESSSAWLCQKCGEKTPGCLPTPFGRFCPQCNYRLIRGAASVSSDSCTESGCRKTVAEHMAECRELVKRIEERSVRL